jgi:undecaprenyl diphosphate synthase
MNTELIDLNNVPQHLAVIMDGNGRWAKKIGEDRPVGHQEGVNSVREVVEGCVELGVKYLTLYAFSTENWNRPQEEIDALMGILVASIAQELPTMVEHNIRLRTIGDTAALPKDCQDTLFETMKKTEHHTGMVLNLALSYSGRWDILNASKLIAQDVAKGKLNIESLSEAIFKSYLTTSFLPDPDLLIRTSGEFRISNFLLWELAYTEIFITDVLWPDFRKSDLIEALTDYQKRERRFGLTGDQIK